MFCAHAAFTTFVRLPSKESHFQHMKPGDLRTIVATLFPHLWDTKGELIPVRAVRSGVIMVLSTNKVRPKTRWGGVATEVVILTCHGICFAPIAHIEHVTDELL